MDNTTKKYASFSKIGKTIIKFEGEKNGVYPILETKVIINGIKVCDINWEEKDNFLYDLNKLINRYKL